MQLLVGQVERFVLRQIGPSANPFQELEPQVGAQCLLDHLLVSLARARGCDLGGSQQLVFDVYGGLSPHAFFSLAGNTAFCHGGNQYPGLSVFWTSPTATRSIRGRRRGRIDSHKLRRKWRVKIVPVRGLDERWARDTSLE